MKALITALITIAASAGAAQAQTQTSIQTAAPAAPWAPQAYVGISAARTPDSGFGRDTVPKLFGGVDFANNVGIEAGYVDFGNQHSRYDYNGDHYDYSGKAHAAYVAGKYTLPLGARFSAYGKLGVAYTSWESRSEINGNLDYRYRASDTGLYGGLGAQYRLNDKLSVNAEFEHFDGGKGGLKSGVWSVGLKYGF